jgi:hypothetical protein
MSRPLGRPPDPPPRPRAVHPRLHVEALEDRRLLALYTVTTELDVVDENDGVLSLREAIAQANT